MRTESGRSLPGGVAAPRMFWNPIQMWPFCAPRMFWNPIQMWPFCAPGIFQNLPRPIKMWPFCAPRMFWKPIQMWPFCAPGIFQNLSRPHQKCGHFARPECSGSPVELLDSATQWINRVEGPKWKSWSYESIVISFESSQCGELNECILLSPFP